MRGALSRVFAGGALAGALALSPSLAGAWEHISEQSMGKLDRQEMIEKVQTAPLSSCGPSHLARVRIPAHHA